MSEMMMQASWVVGWGAGLTGPTTPASGGPCCGGRDWGFVPVSCGKETIAIIPNQDGETWLHGRDGSVEAIARAHLIAAAPYLREALQRLVVQMQNLIMVCDVPERFADSFNEGQRQAEAALAKAQGDQ